MLSLFFGGGDGVKSCIHYEQIVPSELSAALPHSQRESLYHMKSSTFLRQGYQACAGTPLMVSLA